jgi:predicted enzyme related to lactoylglutathione lyase
MPPSIDAGHAHAMTIQRMDHVGVAVDDLDDVVTRMQTHGAELIGEVAQYEDMYRLCYLRGPDGIIVALAEQLT